MRYIPPVWRVTVACLATALCVAPTAPLCSAGEPTTAERAVDELIAQLGSENFEVREAATRRLREREDAIPALRRAHKSKDAEVARRAGEILDWFAHKENERTFVRFSGLVKRGAVDQAIETFVRCERWNDEKACWKALADLAGRLTKLERKSYKKASLPEYPRLSEETFAVLVMEAELIRLVPSGAAPMRGERHLVLRAEEVVRGGRVRRALVALSGSMKVEGLDSSFIFAGGSVAIGMIVDRSLIVCDGDFKAHYITNSLIIARGNIRCTGTVLNSRLISCGDVLCKQIKDPDESKVVEHESKPLGFVKFFDPADVGLKVESADGGVRVKSAEKGKPFAAAGLRADDLITTLDGKAAKDAETFRRLLRAKVAVGGEIVLKVRRDDKALDVRVTWKD